MERQLFEQRRRQGKKVPLEVRPSTQNDSDIRISFLLHTMFKGADIPPSAGSGGAYTVCTELRFASDKTSLTWSCLHAMATVCYGSGQRDRSLLAAGYKGRGTTLLRLRDALKRPSDLSGDVIAAVALARLFETMLPGTNSQWVIHAQGLARLFDTMGPEAFTKPEMRQLFENNRLVMITASSASRTPSIFNTVPWKTVPWRNAHKDTMQQLQDVYCRVPAIHAAWDDYHAGRDPASLVSQLRVALTELHFWRLSAKAEITASAWSPVNTPLTCDWRSAVSFNHVHHAYALALYNMIVILLTRYIMRFPESANIVQGPASKELQLLHCPLLPLGDPGLKAAIAADEIAAILPWTLEDCRRGAGSMYMGGPMHVANQFWREVDPEKAQWSKEVIKHINAAWSSLVLMDLFQMPH